MNQKLLFFIIAVTFVLGQTTAQAQLIIYEGFEYTAGDPLAGSNTGTGFDAAWTTTDVTDTANLHVVGAGLSLGSLEVAGGSMERAIRNGRSTAARTISSAAQTALTADGSTVWFSVLADPTINTEATGGQFGNTYGTIVLGNAPLTDASNGNQLGAGTLNAGDAVGVGFFGGPTGFVDGGLQGITFTGGVIDQDDGATNSVITDDVVSLVVGEIAWGADGTADDTLTLYNVTDPSAALPAAFATKTFVVDQTTFNILSVSDGQTAAFDEIRFGLTLADVLPTADDFLLGDVNLDGAVNFLDISPFIAVLAANGFQLEADINGDGSVNFLDISPFIGLL